MRASRDSLRTAAALGVVFLTLLAAPAAASVNLASHAGSSHASTPVTFSFDDDHGSHDHRRASGGSSGTGSKNTGSSSGGSSSSGSSVTPVTNSGAS